MRGVKVSILFFVVLCFVKVPVVMGGHVFNSVLFTDEIGDGVDFAACFEGETIIPMPLPMEIESIEVNPVEDMSTGDVILLFEVSLLPAPLPHMSYTVEITLDVDDDQTTGASSPSCFYNGGGADYDFGVQVIDGSIESTWYDMYVDGGWVTEGELHAEVVEQKVLIPVPASVFDNPVDGKYNVHVIIEGALDSAPSSGKGLVPIEFRYLPEVEVVTPEAVEGTEFNIDVISFSRYGVITSYEWDFENDGVYEISAPESSLQYMFPDDGSYIVNVRVIDELGISTVSPVTMSVTNAPPYDLNMIHAGNTTDDEVSFTGFAVDPGNDDITYTWDFGDGNTGEGEDVSNQYETPGTYVVIMTATDDGGAVTIHETTIDIIQPLTIVPDPEGGRRRDYYTVGILALFLAGGAWYWGRSQPKPEPKDEEKKEEEPKPKDFCEEHPEVVEQEEKACWDAQMDLETSVGDVQDNYDEALPGWQSNAASITKLITEWDTTVQMINYWTGVEDDIEKDAETVQEVAGFVTNAAGKAKTAFQEGGEAALKELGEDVAKDVGKSVLGDISSTIGQVLELEGWAIKEIGLGIAKGLTGVDPEANAVKLRKQSEKTFAGLCSWVSHSEAWNSGRRPPDTLQSMLEDIQGMQNALDQAKQAFQDAVKDFKCVMCDIPEHIGEEIDALEKNLEKWEKTFDKLKEEVEKRLEEAKELYKDKDLYESPYEYLDKAQSNINRANKALG